MTSRFIDMHAYPIPKHTHAEPRLLIVSTMVVTIRSFLIPIAQHFQSKGWRVDALASGIESDALCRAAFDRVWEADWSRNPLRLRNLMMAKRVRDLVREGEYDLVHVHTPTAAFVTRFALNELRQEEKLKVLYTAHGFHFHPIGGTLRNGLFEYLERKAANWTDILIVINREDLATAKKKRLLDPDRLRYMPGVGIDRSSYTSCGVSDSELNQLYAELGISAATPILLMVAEFTERKRQADAIRAFAKLRSPQARLVLAGAGERLEPMRRLATQLGLSGRVLFLGHRSDVAVLLKACRALVLPSAQEGLPRSVLEALSMGVPVVGSRIRGIAELLDRGAGLLVEPGNVDELAEAMQSILDDPDAAASMGQIGRQQSGQYDLAQILHMHEALYEEALSQSRVRSAGVAEPTSLGT